MKLFDNRASEGITLTFDARQLVAANLFASTDTARPILAAVAVCFRPEVQDAFGRFPVIGFVSCDSYRLGLVGDANCSPMELRERLADDATQYVLIDQADIKRLKVTKAPAFATAAITGGSAGRVTITTHKVHGVQPNMMCEVKPDSLADFVDQVVAGGRTVEGDYVNWPQLLPAHEPSMRELPYISFNAHYLADLAKFAQLFESWSHKSGPPSVQLVLRGGGSELKPFVYTMRLVDVVQLVGLIMPVSKSDVDW